MISYVKTIEGFKLYYKDYLLFNHTDRNPFLKIGRGNGRYKVRFGEFKIREKQKKKVSLQDFELISQTEDEVIMMFKSSNYEMKLVFKNIDSRLEIIPECKNSEINRFWISFQAFPSEAIYGCGEQYSELNLRGKKVPLWVEEQGIGRGTPPITGDWYTTYFPQPTFISSSNYYCHFEASSYAVFDFTNEFSHDFYIWQIPEKIVIGKFNSTLNVVSNLSEYLGRQPKLPDWVYDGVWLGIQGGPDVVDRKVNICREKGVKVSGVWCQDWQGIRMKETGKRLFWDWIYDNKIYPDLPEFIKELKRKGIKFLGYINSFLTIEGTLYKEALKEGYCVRDKNNKDYDISTDSGPTRMIDLSNNRTYEWLKKIITKNMIKIGLAGWMADYGEYLPCDAVLSSGEFPELYHNKYPVLWAKLNYEAIKEAGKLGEIVFFTRAGYSKVSNYTPLLWAGDQLVNWGKGDGLPSVIPAAISVGLCGIGYFHSDIGGFHTLPDIRRDKELLLRWTELEAFTPVMRSHEGVMPDLNWQFDHDDESLTHLARMSQIYVHLKPYFRTISEEYVTFGYPLIRGLFLHYENDKEVHQIKYQYLIGRDLLFAPVIKPKTKIWKVYLPDDGWIHLWSGNKYTGGWYEINAPIGQPPIFYREQSGFSDLFDQIKNI
ncbi:MAG: alpha-glucosidase [Candidatus Lokiarchaeota archaeon]|nr:alpha-glucosidase [Candidatus Lokiarchaeota archaeon]MBD3337943.1 alpha-glucosidase [Candidatus Lokiarchaeota archaeon]